MHSQTRNGGGHRLSAGTHGGSRERNSQCLLRSGSQGWWFSKARTKSAMFQQFQHFKDQYTPSELLLRWSNSFRRAPSPQHLSDVGLEGAVSDHFCDFQTTAIRLSHPLHTVIGQLCRGEKGARVSLSALFFHSLHNYITCVPLFRVLNNIVSLPSL